MERNHATVISVQPGHCCYCLALGREFLAHNNRIAISSAEVRRCHHQSSKPTAVFWPARYDFLLVFYIDLKSTAIRYTSRSCQFAPNSSPIMPHNLYWQFSNSPCRSWFYIVRPHRYAQHKTRSIVTYVAWYVCLCVCVYVSVCLSRACSALTDKPIEVWFGMWTRVEPRIHRT